MPHEVEIHDTGQAALASAREVPWHQLGYVAPGAMTAAELLDNALLADWNVRKVAVPAVPDTATGQLVDPGGQDHLVARTNPVTGAPERLGMVGKDYQVIQNEDHAQFLQDLVDESGAVFETGGSLDGGRRVFVTMKLPDFITVGGTDRVDLHIAAFNRHDGWGSFVTVVTPVRVVCANTERAALRNVAAVYRLRHTSGLHGHLGEARSALRLHWNYAEQFQAEAEELVTTPMGTSEFEAFANRLMPLPRDAGKLAHRNHTAAMNQLTEIFARADTTADIRHTRWAAYNAVTEYLDHQAPVRSRRQHAVVRAERALVDDNRHAQLKRQAFELLAHT